MTALLRIFGLTLALFAVVCAAREGAAPARGKAPARSKDGELTLLSYNIAGLPQLLSQSDPEANIPVIGTLLNHYDLALVQEDFVYHSELASRAGHPHRSIPRALGGFGISDGLSRFSTIPFWGHQRETWARCHGYLGDGCDCLAHKGFSYAAHEIAGRRLHVYNVHLDAGQAPRDVAARSAEVDQILSHIERHTTDGAVIIAGDTNFSTKADAPALERLLAGAGLTDACRELDCDGPDLIDRVMYKSSGSLRLAASRYYIDKRFVRDDGSDLSDHKPVAVVFKYDTLGARAEASATTRASHVTQHAPDTAPRRDGHARAGSLPNGSPGILRDDLRRAAPAQAPDRLD